MPRPSSVTAEIEFAAGTWTDVSADVDWAVGWSSQTGRTSPGGIPQTSTLSLTLYNATGKYTPGLEVLSDGTAAPYWPNVVTRKRLRVSVNGTVRWLGYIKGWYPQLVNGVLGKVVVQAADRMDALARVNLLSPMRQVITNLSPSYYWPCTDAAGSTTAVEAVAGGTSPLLSRNAATTVFGGNGPGVGEGTGITATAAASSTVGGLSVKLPSSSTSYTVVMWVNPTALPGWVVSGGGGPNSYLMRLVNVGDVPGGAGPDVTLDPTSGVALYSGGTSITAWSLTPDGGWHMVAAAFDGAEVYVALDANPLAGGFITPASATLGTVHIGHDGAGTQMFQGGIGQVTVYNRRLANSDLTNLYQAGLAYYGETVDARIARFLGYAGLTSADWSLDASTVTLGTYDQAGKDVLGACQDAVASEGGGSVFYVRAGVATFKNRNARKPGTPALTLDAVRDLDRNVWQPSEDDSNQLNQIIVSRSTSSGVQSTQTIDKSAGGPVLNTTLTTYTTADQDALNLAQDVLAQNLTPGFRLPQVSVDLVHAENNLYTAAATVGIGSRLRATSVPAGQAPATQLDSLAEGWREEYSKANGVESYRMTFDTSAADSPPMMLWDDATYGRWQGVSLALRDAITAGATTLVVASSRTNLCSNGSFETNTVGWAAGGTVAPTLTQSAVRAFVGTKSMLITWGTGGSLPQASTTFTAVAGTVYTVSAKVWVPTGSPNATLNINNGGAIGGGTALKDQWATISQTFTATASASTSVQIWPASSPTAGQQCFVDAVLIEASTTANPYLDTTSGDATQPVFTTDPTMYPLNVVVAAEIITLNSAPGTSTSPQTFTGVTRAVNGTAASAQAGGSAVDVYQPATWGL